MDLSTANHDGIDVKVEDTGHAQPTSLLATHPFNNVDGPQSPFKRRSSPNTPGESKPKRERSVSPDDLPITGSRARESYLEHLLADASATTQVSPSQDPAACENSPMPMMVRNAHDIRSDELARRESLPYLNSVSTELLAAFAEGSYEETTRMLFDPYSDAGKSFFSKKSLFEQTKALYAPPGEFLFAERLGITEPNDISILRAANMVIFANTVFGGRNVGFYSLNDYFLEIFVPEGGDLEEEAGNLLLSLKTQVYLSVMSTERECEKRDLLDYLFPDDFGARLLERHHSDKELAMLKEMTLSESKFLTELAKRRALLLNETSDPEVIAQLSIKYPWEGYLKLFTNFLRTHKKGQVSEAPRSATTRYSYNYGGNKTAHANGMQNSRTPMTMEEVEREAERAASAALGIIESMLKNLAQESRPSGDMNPRHHQDGPPQHVPNDCDSPIPPTQSAPTQVLYEQARQASFNKSAPSTRRPGLPSHRKPWTPEEENALMAGLDRVRGPHWSQILALYGTNGQISEILKGRTQVQLKDKARNLKLFFLKSNIEVPYYLQAVTGELKTRAPSLAQRKEAEEQARMAEGLHLSNGQASQYQYSQQHHSPYGALHSTFSQQPSQQQPSQEPPSQAPSQQPMQPPGQQPLQQPPQQSPRPPPPQSPQPAPHRSPRQSPQQHPHRSPQQSPEPHPRQPSPPPSQQPGQPPMEHGSSSQGTEILDPVGPDRPSPQSLLARSHATAQTQEEAVQEAMQEMSTDEHRVAAQ